jgi:predicted PurR-regulated permease PerM
VLAVALAAVAVLIWVVLSKAVYALLLLFIAIVIAEAMRPVVAALRRAYVPRPLGVLLVYLAAGAVLGGLTWFLIQPLLAQVASLEQALPGYLAQLQDFGNQAQQMVNDNPNLRDLLASLQGQLTGQLGALVPALVAIPVSAATALFNTVIVLTMAFFWLTSAAPLRPFLLSLLPASAQGEAGDVLDHLSRSVGGYVRGVVVNMGIVGILSGVGLFLLGVPYALLLAIVAALLQIVPFIGPYIAGAIALLVALANGGWLPALEVLVLFVAIQQLEMFAIVPLVMRRAVKLNPLLMVFALLVGAAVLGFLGAVLAVPMAVALQVLTVRVIAPVIRHQMRRGEQGDSGAAAEEAAVAGVESVAAPMPTTQG